MVFLAVAYSIYRTVFRPEVEYGAEAGIFRSGEPLKRAKRIRAIEEKPLSKPPLPVRRTPVLTEEDAGFRALFLSSPQPKWVFDPEDLRILGRL
jgi:hypothetical protein